MALESGKMEWCVLVLISMQWITVMCVYTVLHNIEMTHERSIVEGGYFSATLAARIALHVLYKELNYLKMTIESSKMEWCVVVFIRVKRVAAVFVN